MIMTIKLDDKTKQQLVTWYNNHAKERYALANPEALFFEIVGRKVLHNDLVFEIQGSQSKSGRTETYTLYDSDFISVVEEE